MHGYSKGATKGLSVKVDTNSVAACIWWCLGPHARQWLRAPMAK